MVPPNVRPTPALARLRLGPLWLAWALLAGVATAQSPRFVISHFAGSDGGAGKRDGTGTSARFRSPGALARDNAGNLYVADMDNHTIRKITPSGEVSTLAGEPTQAGSADGRGRAARFDTPAGLAVDGNGNVFVADHGNRTIRKITPSGDVTTLAGSPGQSGGTDGTGPAARFTNLHALAVDSAGTIYATDTDTNFATQKQNIRKITPGGSVTTLAATDAAGQPVKFRYLQTLCVDVAGNLLVFDSSPQLSHNTNYRIDPAGVATVITPPGSTSSLWGTVSAAAVDATGQVYLAYPYNGGKIVRITPSGAVETVVGSALYSTGGLVVDPAGNVTFTLTDWHTVNRVSPLVRGIATVAGLIGEAGYKDGAGGEARFFYPVGATLDAAGNLYVGESTTGTIRKITPDGVVSTYAGVSGEPFVNQAPVDGPRASARFGSISGLAMDPAGHLWVAEAAYYQLRRISPDGQVTTVAGSTGRLGLVDGTGDAARFDQLGLIATDLQGNAYAPGRSTVRKITPAGVVTTLAGSDQVGTTDGTGTAARLWAAGGIAVDAAGNVFISDPQNHTIRKITATGVVTTIAGTPGSPGLVDGVGAAARFFHPAALALDTAGNLLVVDRGNDVIRRLAPDGTVTTLAGRPGIQGADDGADHEVCFDSLSSIVVDQAGAFYVTEFFDNAIRKGTPGTVPVITAQPQGLNVVPGASVQLSVTAAGSPSPTYQWHFNGAPFEGATGNSLSFSNARPSDAGDYTVVVTNALSSVTSAKATLSITAAPVVTPPASSGGGGGGAPSLWFLLGLFALGTARRLAARSGI